MPDTSGDGGNTESTGGGYGGTGDGFGGGDPGFGGVGGYGAASQVDAATIAGVLAGSVMAFSGNPALASVGLMAAGGTLLGGNVQQAISDFNNTNLDIGPGPGLGNMQAGTADFSAVSGGPGVTDYFNSSGQLVGATFDQAAYDQYNNFMQSLGSSEG